jgi:periplasmic copper chaperone A
MTSDRSPAGVSSPGRRSPSNDPSPEERCIMYRVTKMAAVIAATLVASAATGHEFKIKGFEFIHPWTREPASGVKDVPVYMVLRNTSAMEDRIVAVSSPFATKGELRAGKAKGEGQIGAIPIGGNATVELDADRPHILLRGLIEPLDGYQYFPLTLTFERAGQMEIEVYVEEPN